MATHYYFRPVASVSPFHRYTLFGMYRENSLNTLACQKKRQHHDGTKMLLHADMKVLKEYKKLLSGGKTKGTLVAYYTNFISETDTDQLNRNIQSSSVVD